MPEKPKSPRVDPDGEARALLDAQLDAARSKKLPEILTAALFALFIAVFAISFWIVPDRDFSENENRSLSQFPKLTVESLTTEDEKKKFTKQFADYMADQFPLRDAFVGVKAACEIALGKSENNGVFVIGDTLAERHDAIDDEKFPKNAEAIDAFISACRERGAAAVFAAFPRAMDAIDIPIYGNGASNAAFERLEGFDHLDMRAALEGHEGEYVYYRTDHHHTTLGAYYAYRYLAPYLGYEANDISHYRREVASNAFCGTTWSKAGAIWTFPDTIEYFRWDGDGDVTVTRYENGGQTTRRGMYFTEFLDDKDKYSSFLGNALVGRIDVSKGEGRKKMLIVKDSFAHSLAPFLAEHYDLTLIDPRSYSRPIISLVDDEGFDAVLVMCNIDTLSSGRDFAKLTMRLD